MLVPNNMNNQNQLLQEDYLTLKYLMVSNLYDIFNFHLKFLLILLNTITNLIPFYLMVNNMERSNKTLNK